MKVFFYDMIGDQGTQVTGKVMDSIPRIGEAVYCNDHYRIINVRWEIDSEITNVIVEMILEDR